MNYENSYSKEINYKTYKIAGFQDGVNTDKDSNLLAINVSPISYNFDFNDGSLKDGLGITTPYIHTISRDREHVFNFDTSPDDSEFIGCWYLNTWTKMMSTYVSFVIFQTAKGNFYYVLINGAVPTYVEIPEMKFTDTPKVICCSVNGVESLFFVSETGVYVYQALIAHKLSIEQKISSICSYNNKIYVTNDGEQGSTIVCYKIESSNMEFVPTNEKIEIFDEYGKINKLISYAGNMYAIRDFNITKISIDKANDITITRPLVSNGRIYEKTVCVCGDKMVYLASDGIYMFNGSSTKKIELNIENMLKGVDNNYATAGYLDGYYYLACYLNFNDGKKVHDESSYGNLFFYNNALLRLNLKTNDITIFRGYEIREVMVLNHNVKSEVCVLIHRPYEVLVLGLVEQSGKFFDKPIDKFWSSPLSDFGYPDRLKCLKEITLISSKDIELQIKTELTTRTIKIKGKNSYQKFKPYITAKQIGINIISKESGNYISNVKLTVGIL